ncbi:zinc finger CCHC domain-containing protein 8 homolog isoform X2 [Schistocerca nitens]|uniref:zinc finger CCHC domain-containing protein 8 homolog isoform X2 n=1 Tax=Schistocerca nitens TaxID=7011 RepID=UPI002119A6A2|nr:zinc finger CCHC domain-containing protein 8 homolog isoform X2 [Schistocerca nitens]
MSISDSIDSDFNGSCSDECVATETSLKQSPTMVINVDEDSANRCDALKPMCPLVDLTDASDRSSCSSSNLKGDAVRKKEPIFSIRFRDQGTARKYQKKIKDFLKDLISKQLTDSEDGGSSDLELDIWEESLEEADDDDQLDVSHLFMVDTHPSMKDDLDIPAYNQKFNEVLQKQEEKSDEKNTPNASVQTCFNCLGNHCLRDCPEPRRPATIARNRRDFMNKHGNTPKVSRYHMDEEQRFARFRPGEISRSLRKALGLSKHQLPRHIYRMRRLGYPPGWMEEARISHSGISLFDSEGQEVADPEDEDGEIVAKGSKDTYDMKKIISYPGFNVPCSPDIIDEFEHYNSPPMAFHQSKEAMLSQLQASPAYKKRKLKITPVATEPKEVTVTPADMEVEEVSQCVSLLPDDGCRFIPPLPKDTPPPPSESDSEGGETRSQETCSPVSTGHSSISSPRPQSPSLSDLEAKKQSLLAELEDGSSGETVRAAATPTLGKIKSVALGTPVLLGRSPYSRLPSPKKFSHNICDVINFENLPDSTGKYEKMTDIIQKVRTVVSRIQSDTAT